MAIWTDDEIDALAASGYFDGPNDVVGDLTIPEWLLDAPSLPMEEPLCACGCGRTESEVYGEAPIPAPRAEPAPVRWAIPGVWDDDPEPEKVVPSVGELVSGLSALVEDVATVDASALPAGQALGEAELLARIEHTLRLARLDRTEDVRARKLYEHSGFRSASAWQHHTAPDTPQGDAALAKALPTLPHLAEALAARQVSFTAAGKVKTALGKVRLVLDCRDGLIDGQPGEPVIEAVAWNVLDLVCKDQFGLEHDPSKDPVQAAFLAELDTSVRAILASGGSQRTRVEAALVLLATHIKNPKALKRALEEIVDQLMPLLLERQEKDAQDKRGLCLKPNTDGTWDLTATLTPEVGEQVFTALAAEARRDPANPLDTHAREQARIAAAEAAGQDPGAASRDREAWEDRALRANGEGFLPDGDQLVPRSKNKRLHDALGRLLTRYLSNGMGGTSGKVPVQVTATISDRTVAGLPGAPPARGASGRPLARSVIRRWWCDAQVTVLLMSIGWKPLGVVHKQRTLTGTELTAAKVQFDNRCPGIECCSGQPDPLIPLVPHHVLMFSATGETCLELNLMCCENLHADLHVGKRTIRLRDGRLITEDGYLHDPE